MIKKWFEKNALAKIADIFFLLAFICFLLLIFTSVVLRIYPPLLKGETCDTRIYSLLGLIFMGFSVLLNKLSNKLK